MKYLCLIYLFCALTSATLESESFILTASNVFNMTQRRSVERWEVSLTLKAPFLKEIPACIHMTHGYIYTYDNATLPFQIGGKARLITTTDGVPFLSPCLYMTNINFHVRKKWKPRVRTDRLGSLGLATECYVPNSLEGQQLCSDLMRTYKTISVQLEPNSKWRHPHKKLTIQTTPISTKYSYMEAAKREAFSQANVILTVQTFRNRMSGPSLYMFMKYYLTLGWKVIVYDRYGLHAREMGEFRDLPEVIYHENTFFETLFPSEFNKQKAFADEQKASDGFKHWHFSAIGRKNKEKASAPLMEEWEMYNQDDDKRATVDMATAHYQQLVKSFFYVDRDELLYCPKGGNKIESQKAYQHRFVDGHLADDRVDEVLLARLNVASLRIESDASEAVVNAALEKCLASAYSQRRMDIFWGCYSSAWIPKTKSKGFYPPDSCPFHELHKPCLRCQCNSVDHADVSECHIIHLSNIVDAKRNPSRVYYSNMTTPCQEMQEMWNNL